MAYTALLTCLILLLFVIAILLWRAIRSGTNKDAGPPLPVELYKDTVVIVPVCGTRPDLYAQLASISNQTYPYKKLIFVTQDADDPAMPTIRQLIGQDARLCHISAGMSEHNSQKNHNLLAGYRAAGELDGIVVFCDSGHIMQPHWLEALITPILLSPGFQVSSGYHQVFALPDAFATTCRSVIVAAMNLMRKIPFASQPWGGSTAISTESFRSLKIAQLWSDTVVDDVVLAARLKEEKVKLAIPDNVDAATHVSDRSYSGLCSWLDRQWAYLKFVFPKTWCALGAGGLIFTLSIYGALLVIATSGLLDYPHQATYTAYVIVLLFLGFCFFLRTTHPAPGPSLRWYPACVISLLFAAWCHALMWFKDRIIWAGVIYTVSGSGKVTDIKRNKAKP